jgi:pimeloyl-ACP methyl ester carboxylesterase
MTIEVLGTETYVVDQGSGPVVLFLHGNPDSSDIWTEIIAQVKDKFRCIAPDLPGYGRSDRGKDFDCSVESIEKFISQLLSTLKITESVYLVVHDFGGILGLAWAIRNQTRIKKIIVTNSVFSSEFKWHFWARVWRAPILGELSMLTPKWIFKLVLGQGSKRLTSQQHGKTIDLFGSRARKTTLLLYRNFSVQTFVEREKELYAMADRVPIKVLFGEHDPYIDPKFAFKFGTKDVSLLKDVGHWVPKEASETVATEMLKFFHE